MCFRLSALLQVDADGFDPADGADRRDRAAVVAVLREADSAAVGDRCLAHQGRGTFRVRDDEQEPLPEAERIGGYGGDADRQRVLREAVVAAQEDHGVAQRHGT